jgi:UDPglucose--hexose-1-phosphate uridylyltransferase
MSDLRFDPLSNQWIAVAKNRRDRPMEFIPIDQTRQQLICPFCRGNEDETPHPSAAYRDDGTILGADDDPSGWTVRVIPNKFPSFRSASDLHSMEIEDAGPYGSVRLPGEQEVVIASPRHVTTLSELTDAELKITFAACQDRIKYAESLPHIEHSMLFMNCRSSAGASLSHIHVQLIGSPLVSSFLTERAQRNLSHFESHGNSLLQSLTEWERTQQKRLILETENFCIYTPYASRFPFQIRIVPKHHHSRFHDCPAEMRDELAGLCRKLVVRLEELLDNPGYNLLLHQAPFSMSEKDHWYLELLPRLTRAAGYEWGTDIWINPVAPETAAKQIRIDA